eukprot:2551833-Karenia_brevis.AAC.1
MKMLGKDCNTAKPPGRFCRWRSNMALIHGPGKDILLMKIFDSFELPKRCRIIALACPTKILRMLQ